MTMTLKVNRMLICVNFQVIDKKETVADVQMTFVCHSQACAYYY